MYTHTTSPVLALLGPTNTGKTHYAIERMLGHKSGMIGFPLRLLARENYDRVVRIKGKHAAALVTGEEKIVPPGASYFLCTVESMPLDREVDFLALDEIQLIADAERGHIFTDRLLRARGRHETLFVGAETARPLIRALVRGVSFDQRPRLSRLSYAGPKKLTRLPPRSAVIGFSAAEIYGLADQLRRQRGGAAVVLGALSPRTRNAQVAMYQNGEVDYIVATDAIGMGLNMDIDHVALAALRKFDGRASRPLRAAEVAQIAGRAGRHLNDGTFGTTMGLGPMDAELVEQVENHRFERLKVAYWRNVDLDFSTPAALARSLGERPPRAELAAVRGADDLVALDTLRRQPEIAALARGPAAVRLLWEVCQIPDFRKILSGVHARLLAQIYRHLMDSDGRLPTDWVARQVTHADHADGDIETLTGRISNIRIWTYIAYRADWLDDGGHWQARTRAIEDRLSNALHDRLTQRFVDRRAASLAKRMRGGDDPVAALDRNGEVRVERDRVGRIEGFRFVLDESVGRDEAAVLRAAALKALRPEVAGRVERFAAEPDAAFTLAEDDRILWRGAPVARLGAGDHVLAPRIEVLEGEFLDPAGRGRLRVRLAAWLDAYLARRLASLVRARQAPLDGAARGIAYQLGEGLGTLARPAVADLVTSLMPKDRKALAALGVKIGAYTLYLPATLKPAAVALRARLWRLHDGADTAAKVPRGLSVRMSDGVAPSYYAACGYRPSGGRAVRVDALEKLAAKARALSRQGPFAATVALARLVDYQPDELAALLESLGYRRQGGPGATVFARKRRQGKRTGAARKPAGKTKLQPDGPFAVLKELTASK